MVLLLVNAYKIKNYFVSLSLDNNNLNVFSTQALTQKLQTNIKNFDQLMRDTLATQDAVFEAEKFLVKNRQKKL